MTKTNKTLLCVLLALVMTFALALTALTITAQTAKAAETTVTFDFTGTTTSDVVVGTIEKDGVSLVFAAGNHSQKLPPKYYSGEIRVYKNNHITFSATGYTVTKIEIKGSFSVVSGGGTFSNNAWTGSSESVTLENSASSTNKVKAITVTIAASHTCTAVEGGEWVQGKTGHYHECSDPACPVTDETKKPDYAPHTFNWTLDTSDTKLKTGVCSVCGYQDIESSAIANIYVNGVKLSGPERQATISIGNQAELTAQLGQAGNPIYPGQIYELKITGLNDKLTYIVSHLDGDNLIVENSTLTAFITVPAELIDELRITVTVDCAHAGKIKHNRIEATCLADGKEEYWECPACGVLSSTEDMSSVISAPIAIAKLAHAYGADHVCTNGCGKTESVNLVEEANKLANGAYLGGGSVTYTIIGVVKSISAQKIVITVEGSDSLEITLFNTKADGESAKIGDKVIATGPIMKYKPNNGTAFVEVNGGTYTVSNCDHANATLVAEVPATTEAEGTKEHYTCADCGKLLVKNGETYTEVTSQDLVIAKLVIVEVTEEISVSQGDNKAKLDAEANKIYLANGGKLVVTYSITQNSGVNALLFTLNYNKTLFKVESVVANAELGEALVVTGDEVQTDVYKVLLEGLKDAYNEKYTGLLVTVTYVYVGNLATFEGADAAFGLDSMEAHKSNTDGTTAPVETKTVLSNVIYDVIKQASITVEKTSFVYNGKAITAIGKGEHDQIKVTADGEGAISYKWYTDGTYATEVGEGYEVKNAGKYYLKLIVATTAAFEGSELKVEITITPFDLKNADSEIVITANDKQVTGSALTWTVAELTINGGNLATARGYDSDENIFTATIAEHSLTNVGETQNVAVTLALNANYTYGGESSIAATVTLKVVAYANAWTTEPQNITKDFDNNKLTFAYAAEHGTPVYYLGGEVKTAEELANAIVNAGTYEVKIVVEVVGYSNLEKTITITINKLKIDASSMVFDYSEDGKIKWINPTKAIGSTGAIDLPTAVKFTYTLVDGKTENYGEDAVLEYLAQAEGAYTLNVIPGDAVNYEGTSTTTKTVYTITFAEGTHDGDNVIEGVAEYATVYRFDGQNAPAAPAAPVLAGYRFDGWTNSGMFGVAVTASVTLTAQWVKTYVIAWNNDNGSALESKTVDAGTQIAYSFETAPTSVLGADDYYTYTFAGWKNGEEVRELGYTFTVNGDITVTATYTSTLAYVDVTYTLTYGNNTTATDTITKVAIDTAVSAIGLPELKAYTWFKNDGWKCGENAFTAATANLANEKVITISATYVFAIGNGDVDGSGTVDPSDIVLYRKHIVGGYDIAPVTDAWTTATAADFDESKVYFLVQVANVDEDGSDTKDVRDVSTIRMALVGAYGYTIKNGAVIKGSDATAQSAKVQYKQVLAPMGLFGKKFAL